MNIKKTACSCANVTYGKIIQAVEQGASSFEEVQQHTNCCQGCGKCRDFVEHYVRQLIDEKGG